ncbi:MAG: D-tyrosyl-tRNA(Tyr) deacylase [Natronospirillum sp.]|uniref:D-aminoacyl-tRNA deacylase n=1 Tax=Natronospirillum sp. TaxID=2812955 RepID=UPI0025EB9ABB|nr:D-aminoacyl-tRNA deacylase [Natronospirillum sp.]MCH8552024.1 D-tyrosyl-tRNA(Tyr) deacylase [Natronospirillum sp.]
MKALLQRVSEADVTVEGRVVGAIGRGLLVLVGLEPDDDDARLRRMLERLLNYRVFPDEEGRMNLSLRDTGGGLLLVSQFTLAADTRKGNRPGFSTAAPPEQAAEQFARLVEMARDEHDPVGAGEFGAMMALRLINDGPVTFLLES